MNKIKIISTTNIKKSNLFPNIDLAYGFSYYCNTTNSIKSVNSENKWQIKILSQIEKLKNSFNSISEKEKDIISTILESCNFFHKYQEASNTKLSVQINTNTSLEDSLYKSSKIIIEQNKNTFIKGINASSAFVYTKEKIVFIGIEKFSKTDLYLDLLKPKFSRKDMVNYVLFHEFAHAFQQENIEKYNEGINNFSFDNIKNNLMILSDNKHYLPFQDFLMKDFNKSKESQINKTGFYCPPKNFIDTLNSVYIETYADVYAMLLIRNKNIHDNVYEPKSFNEQITKLSEARTLNKSLNKFETDTFFDTHLTSPGLDHLKEIMIDFKNKEMSVKEIHFLATKCMNLCVSKVILALCNSNEVNKLMINTIASVKLKYGQIVIDKNKDHYKEVIKNAKENVSVEWLEQCNDRLQKIKQEGLKYDENLLFNAYINVEEFNKDLSKKIRYKNNVPQMMEFVKTLFSEVSCNEENRITTVSISTQDKVSDILIKKEDINNRISTMREDKLESPIVESKKLTKG